MRIGQYTIKGQISQQPNEVLRRIINYQRWLEVGEVIETIAIAITPVTSPVLVISNLIIDPDGTRIAYNTSGGLDGCGYTVEFTVTTSVGQVREDEVLIGIKEVLRG